MKTTAAVLEATGGEFTLKDLAIGDPGPGEVLFEVAGVGLCHTDIAVREGHLPFPFPGVLGHEGSGTVLAVGEGVTKVGIGDRVAASFNSCGKCTQCRAGVPAYCLEFMDRNFGGARPDGTSALSHAGQPVASNFFGQSTFARHAMARERNVVKIPESVPLEIAGPLGCGVQTGAGAVLNALDAEQGSSLLVTGGGSVGLSGVLAAVARGVGTVIVSDPLPQRRELALSLGATHVVDPTASSMSARVREILPEGVDYVLDTTAMEDVIIEILASMGQRGHLGMVGVPQQPQAALNVNLLEMQARGMSFTGIVEGNSDPDSFIPELIALYEKGVLPFDRLVTTLPFDRINEAVAAQASGEAVKVVLVHG
ncbi:NAD(P)-dependent alcohol dehydrogenase [Nocardiopsis oceani]